MTDKHLKKPHGKHEGHHYIDKDKNIAHATNLYEFTIHRLFGFQANPIHNAKLIISEQCPAGHTGDEMEKEGCREERYFDCPYCGHLNTDYGGDEGFNYDEVVRCEKCGKSVKLKN